MRVLLVQFTPYVPTFGGANKCNKLVMEALAARGHECHAIALAASTPGAAGAQTLARELDERGIAYRSAAGVTAFERAGVAVQAFAEPSVARALIARTIPALRPDWVLVSSEDPGYGLLAAVVRARARVVYVAHTTLALPFGPGAYMTSAAGAALLRQVPHVVAVSDYLGEYLQTWGGIRATVLPFNLFDATPALRFGRWGHGDITMVNPCAVKGLSIFLDVARALPSLAFAAVPAWGTTADDLAALAALPNVRVRPPADDIDDVLRRCAAVMVPSLWCDARPRIVVEAMLRGLPVVGSDSGGIPEAKLGVPYVIPVRTIERYTDTFDDRRMPVPLVPPQDAAPWIDAIHALSTSEATYADIAERSHHAATAYVEQLGGVQPFETFLLSRGD